jgi:hypothetical protein
VHGAREVRATFVDGVTYVAYPVGDDPSTDLAVLKVDHAAPAFAALGNSGLIRQGQLVVAIGNPFRIPGDSYCRHRECARTYDAIAIGAADRWCDSDRRRPESG